MTIIWSNLVLKQASNIACACASLLLIAVPIAESRDVTVMVVDGKGAPVQDAVVTLTPAAGGKKPAPTNSEITQASQEFTPLVAIIPVGSRVRFPNKDNVAHHVYSFSPVKKFDLPLYTGEESEAVIFDRPGVVKLGCNIHDWMVAHLFVTDTAWFGLSEKSGRVILRQVPAGTASLEIWHPRLKGNPVQVALAADENGPVNVQLDMRPDFKRRRAPGAGDAAGGYQ